MGGDGSTTLTQPGTLAQHGLKIHTPYGWNPEGDSESFSLRKRVISSPLLFFFVHLWPRNLLRAFFLFFLPLLYFYLLPLQSAFLALSPLSRSLSFFFCVFLSVIVSGVMRRTEAEHRLNRPEH